MSALAIDKQKEHVRVLEQALEEVRTRSDLERFEQLLRSIPKGELSERALKDVLSSEMAMRLYSDREFPNWRESVRKVFQRFRNRSS